MFFWICNHFRRDTDVSGWFRLCTRTSLLFFGVDPGVDMHVESLSCVYHFCCLLTFWTDCIHFPMVFFPGASFRSVQELHEDPGFFLEEVESWSFTSMLHPCVGCLITHSGPLILTQDQNEQPRTLQGGASRGSGVLLLLFDACG